MTYGLCRDKNGCFDLVHRLMYADGDWSQAKKEAVDEHSTRTLENNSQTLSKRVPLICLPLGYNRKNEINASNRKIDKMFFCRCHVSRL